MSAEDYQYRKASAFFAEAVRVSDEQGKALNALRGRASAVGGVLGAVLAVFISAGVFEISPNDHSLRTVFSLLGAVAALVGVISAVLASIGVRWQENPMGYSPEEAEELKKFAKRPARHERFDEIAPDVAFLPLAAAHYRVEGTAEDMLWEHGTYLQDRYSKNRLTMLRRERFVRVAIFALGLVIVAWTVVLAVPQLQTSDTDDDQCATVEVEGTKVEICF